MKLNLCCGTNVFPGWLNVDRTDVEADYLRHLRDAPPAMQWPAEQQKLVDHIQAGKPLEFMRHDVRLGLPWSDGSIEAIYIGQAIEHFNRRTEAPALLRECLRALGDGGAIRLTTPDLNKLIHADDNYQHCGEFKSEQPEFFAEALPEDQFSYLAFGASGAGSTNESYEGHHHCYTPRSLMALLNEVGFMPPPQYSKLFADCIDKGMSHSFGLEAVKP